MSATCPVAHARTRVHAIARHLTSACPYTAQPDDHPASQPGEDLKEFTSYKGW
jgi:hypothetical protein